MRLFALVVALLCPLGCSTVQKTGGVTAVKSAAEQFHQRVRWKDFRGAVELIIPERRDGFEKARSAADDERDLNITDYQLEDVRLSADGMAANVVSKLSWHRLPSVTESTATVTSEFLYRDGAWYLARQDKGPFKAELSAPLPPPKPPSATP